MRRREDARFLANRDRELLRLERGFASGRYHLFRDRSRFSDVVELASRVGTDKVAEARRRLECAVHDRKQRVDCAVATNMIIAPENGVGEGSPVKAGEVAPTCVRTSAPVSDSGQARAQRNGGEYCSPPSVHSAFRPRSRPIGVSTPMLRSKISP